MPQFQGHGTFAILDVIFNFWPTFTTLIILFALSTRKQDASGLLMSQFTPRLTGCLLSRRPEAITMTPRTKPSRRAGSNRRPR